MRTTLGTRSDGTRMMEKGGTAMDEPTPVRPEDLPAPTERAPRGGAAAWWLAKLPLLVVLALSGAFLYLARDLEVGSLTEPGPGLWPTLIAVLLAATALVGLALSTADGIERFGPDAWRVGVGVVVLWIFIMLFGSIGLILPGLLLTVFWLRVLAQESWRISVGVAVGATFACYFLFVTALGVVFPDDLVAQLWGGR